MSRLPAFLALAALVSCAADQPPSVILISIDTLRNDHCSGSGYARPTTPRLDAFAREGARMALAYAPTSTTGPSHASMFTSLYPIVHGVLKNGASLSAEHPTLAEMLRGRGYATEAVVSSFVLNAKFGYSRGFDGYDDHLTPEGSTIHQERFQGHEVGGGFDQRANVATDKALAVLERLRRARKPFFLFVHYFDPHSPYAPPPEWAARFVTADAAADDLARTIDGYDGEVAFADHEIGRLLDGVRDLGIARDTLVVITADHGEGLMQHGHMEHGVNIYEEAVRVPLLFRFPGRIEGGRHVAEPVVLLDVFPTVMELTGGGRTPGLQGRSLAPALTANRALDTRRPIYLYRRHYRPGYVGEIQVAGDKFGIRIGPWKYIEGEEEGTRELFNLDADPGERRNVYDPTGQPAQDLGSALRAWRGTLGRRNEGLRLSPDDRERLRALGYVE